MRHFSPSLLILIVGLIVGLTAWPVQAQELQFDTSAVEAREVPPSLLRFQDDPAYQFDRAAASRETIWQRLRAWFYETFIAPTSEHIPPWAVEVGLYFLAAVLLGFLLVQLLTGRKSAPIARRSHRSLDRALAKEGIEHIDLGAWLRRALAAGQYREAVRVHYLIALQELAGRGAVTWSPEKTNRAYVAELGGLAAAEPFAAFTDLFDHVVYGSRSATEGEVAEAERFRGMVLATDQPRSSS